MSSFPWVAVVSVILELIGVAAIVAGLGLLAPWAGLIGAGVALVLFGVAVDPPTRRGASE